ncbi:hypothetical protein UFOVP265_55 [uncultured Caudovirales phage]|jgi:hypothetical protein|uniref:Uncharacterized protein n=1 Tax=uncultured Caudovirales phage TaxID=2100421 RepID=A0A6J5LH11_9CAUD|nr:hypothetical protein UFOVP265_55 [uncultured Caudovirales phage]
MNTTQENYINHEVRIRLQESKHEDISKTLIRLEQNMDSQFKCIIGTILTIFLGTILPIVIGVILHFHKII